MAVNCVILIALFGGREAAYSGITIIDTDDSDAPPIRQFLKPPPNIYLLAVGVNKYNTSSLFYNLVGSVPDAESVSDAFKNRFKRSAVHSIVLTDSQATKAGIRAAIQSFANVSKSDDLFVFTFSGHAFKKMTKNGQQAYLMPADVHAPPGCKDVTCIDESNLISDSLLNSWMTQMHAQRQILLLDTSYSDMLLPIFENRWRGESCRVGADASKRLLIITNHNDGFEVTDKEGTGAHGYLTSQFVAQLFRVQQKGFTSAFWLQQSLYMNLNSNNPQRNLPQAKFRVDLLGGDFVVDGPAAGVAEGDLLQESGLGAICYNEASGASRGLDNDNSVKDTEQAKAKPTATNYALVVATDHYKSWPVLTNPIYDATTIENDLKNIYGFETDQLYDPTRDQLIAKLQALHAQKFNDNDQLFIFIAGHGDYDATNDIGYLVFANTPLGHDYDAEMNLQELRQRINTIPAKHIFLVMDSCFAGSLDPALGSGSRGIYYPIPLEQLRLRTADKKTRYFLTSGGKEYVPDGMEGSHSPFAALFILALEKGSNTSGYLNLSQLPHYFERMSTIPRAGNLGETRMGQISFLFRKKTSRQTPTHAQRKRINAAPVVSCSSNRWDIRRDARVSRTIAVIAAAVFAIVLRGALAQEDQTGVLKPMTAMYASGCNCAYPSNVWLGDPDFRAAVKGLVGEKVLAKEPWFPIHGSQSPVEVVTQGGDTYLMMKECMPHNCPDHVLVMLYETASKKVVVLLVTPSRWSDKTRRHWFGRPAAPEKKWIEDEVGQSSVD